MTVKAKNDQSLASILGTVTKAHGERAVVRPTDNLDMYRIKKIPTGILAVDIALEGGLPVGKMVEFFGPESSGKTSVAMRTAGEMLRDTANIKEVVYVDAENGFDPVMAAKSNVDVDRLHFSYPDSAEEVFEVLEMLISAQDLGLVIVDSVAAMTSRAEIEGDYGDSHMGVMARLMSSGLKKLNRKMQEVGSQTTIIWINQIREKIGTMSYGPQTTTTGGRALKFYCGTRLEVVRTGAVKQQEDIVGHSVKVKVAKNRYAPPYRTASFDILYETGVSNEGTLLDLAICDGLVTQAGSWYSLGATGEKLGQGRLNVLQSLKDDPALYQDLLKAVTL